jgi:hypothetical protein
MQKQGGGCRVISLGLSSLFLSWKCPIIIFSFLNLNCIVTLKFLGDYAIKLNIQVILNQITYRGLKFRNMYIRSTEIKILQKII